MAVIPRSKPALDVPSASRGPRQERLNVGKGYQDASDLLAGLADNMIEQRRSNEVARKKIEIYKRLGSLASDVSMGHFRSSEDLGFARSDTPGGDFSIAPDAFEALAGQEREEILAGIDDPRVREAVALEFDMTQAQKMAVVRNAAVKQMRDKTVAELDVNTEVFARTYSDATTEQERLQIVQAYRDQLIGAVSTGAITREDMVSRSQDFRNTVAELGVRKDLLGATRNVEATEEVLNKLRDPNGYPGLTPEARQSFEEQALRQFHSAVNFEFMMEERQERLDARRLKKRREANTRDLAAKIRPVDPETGEFGAPQIGHVEIDRAFQAGEITSSQTNYLRSLLDHPDPTPDPLLRFSYLGRFMEQAYDGTLEPDDVYRARAAGSIEDNDVNTVLSIHSSRQAAGGRTATNDAKQALEFVTSYLFGVKSIFNVQLTDDKVRRLGAVELLFNGRVSRGENPYRVAADLVQEDSRAIIDESDIPPQVLGMFREHKRNGTMSEFWDAAREKIEGLDLSVTERRSLVTQLENTRNTQGKSLERLPEILEELRIRADNYDRTVE